MYIVELPNQSANALLNVLRGVVPGDVTTTFHHLRRFAKPEYLPAHLQQEQGDDDDEKPVLMSTRETKSTTSHMLICPTSAVTLSALEVSLQDHVELFKHLTPTIRVIDVPVFAPTSAAQATEWSQKYWPTIYKNTNPYGPHPALVRRAELELLAHGDADNYMALASQIGHNSTIHEHGVGVGVVIVERVPESKQTRVVAVAGDARFCGLASANTEPNQPCDTVPAGNVMAHAVLRAIAMVAQKRRLIAQLTESADNRNAETQTEDESLPEQAILSEPESYVSGPVSDHERHYLARSDNLTPNGYLCLDLEIYLTHEPCVMCAMAILHSRISRLVFHKAMPLTGALNAEKDSLGQGLFWRDQLNWKSLAWQWTPLEGHDETRDETKLRVHA